MKTCDRYVRLAVVLGLLAGSAHAQQILSYFAANDFEAAGLRGGRLDGWNDAGSTGAAIAFHQASIRGWFDEPLDLLRISAAGFKGDVRTDRSHSSPEFRSGPDVERKVFPVADGGEFWVSRGREYGLGYDRDKAEGWRREAHPDTVIPEPPMGAVLLGAAAFVLIIGRRRLRLKIGQG